MAVRVQNVTDEPHQNHVMLVGDFEVDLTIRFLPVVQSWFLSVSYAGEEAAGYRMAVDTPHMLSRNFPFDFVVRDTSGAGLDPIRRDDFATGRCALYMLEPDDMEDIRGGPVPIQS